MEPRYRQDGRSEKLIAVARAVLAALAMVAVRVDPSIAGWGPRPLFLFMAGYALWSLLLAAGSWRAFLYSSAARRATHAVDIAAATVIIAATQTPISPLFPLYIFVIFSATLRFQVRGVVATGVLVAALYTSLATWSGLVEKDTLFFLTRLVHILIATLLLAFLRSHQARAHDDLTRLAAWPRRAYDQREPLVRAALEHAAVVLRAPRVGVVFEETDEPWLWVGHYADGTLELTRERPDLPVVTPEHERATFFCPDAQAKDVVTTVAADTRVERTASCPVSEELVQRFRMRAVLSAPFAAETASGRLFFLDVADATLDEMVLSIVVAHLFVARLDEFAFIDAARHAAAGEERVRLARNLHDTLLQSLTAIGLHVETLVSQLATDPDGARQRARAVQELIERSQAELRADIARLRPRGEPAPARSSLARRLAELPLWLLQQWDAVVAVEVEPRDADLPEPLATEILRLVNEAVANAAKHARASQIGAKVTIGPNTARIVVTDDGEGLPFHGKFDLAALEAEDRGPRTLRERVSALRGRLQLISSPAGTTVEMTIPVRRKE